MSQRDRLPQTRSPALRAEVDTSRPGQPAKMAALLERHPAISWDNGVTGHTWCIVFRSLLSCSCAPVAERPERKGPAMNAFDVAQGFVDLCVSPQSPTSGLTSSFRTSISALGFRYFAFCSHVDPLNPPPKAMLIHNYPSAWEQRYSDERFYEIDPIFQRSAHDPIPFFWDTVFHAGHIKPVQRKILIDAADFGLVHGYTIPIHLSWLPGSLRASCSLVPQASSVSPINFLMAETMAVTLYATLNRAYPSARCVNPVELSRRERQCLSLAARGKDDWAIGQLLHLSQLTVHSYFRRLMQRIGVATRVQAIVWALENGEIPFGDVVPGTEPPIPAE